MKSSIEVIYRSHPCVFTGIAMLFLINVLFAESSPESLISERGAKASDSFSLLQSGDKAYASGDFTTAVRDFQKGFAQLSVGEATQTLKAELADRYGTAASQEAKRLMRVGNIEEAKSLLETVLSEDVAPNNQAALRVLEKLNDPIATNPALTKAFVQDVDQVRRLLYQAEGAYNLGKFDEAEEQYKRVLRVDSYNRAARRGLERVTQRKVNYYRASYDSARAKMLSDVDKEWELPGDNAVENSGIITDFNAERALSYGSLSSKLDLIILPRVDFQNEDIYEVTDTLRALVKNSAEDSLDPNSGVQFVLKIPEGSAALSKTITLNLSDVPLRKVIDSVASDLGLTVSVDDYAVVLSSYVEANDSLMTRSFNVSPNFLSRSVKKEQASNDPFSFNEERASGSLLGKKLTAREILEDLGIQFEGSATASFLPSTSTLIVKNTPAQLNIAENILNALAREQPVMIALETKLISVQAINDEELSTDWTVEGTILNAIANGIGVSGGSVGTGKTNEGITGSPITAGNRSGGTGNAPDSIDLVIEREMGEPGRVQASFDPFILANTGSRQDALLGGIISDSGSFTTNNQNYAPAPGVFSVSAGLDSATVNAMLRGLSQKKGTDFLIKPSVTTRSGQRATVKIGKEFTYVSEYEPPEISQGSQRNNRNNRNRIDDLIDVAGDPTWYYIWDPDDLEILDAEIAGITYQNFTTAVTPSHPSAFKTVILGTELEIEPTLDENGKTISLAINSVYRDFDGFINYGFPINAFSTEIKFQQNYIDDNLDFLTQELTPEFDAYINFDFDEFRDPGAPFQENILEVEERFFQATPNFILMPVFQTIRVQTNVTVHDGATLILGGLINSTRQKVQDKVPILGNLPLVGKAFTSEIDQTVKKQILLAITAKVIDPTGRPINASF